MSDLLRTAPLTVASLAISLAVVVSWLAAFLLAIGTGGLNGRERWIQFFSPGDVPFAIAMVVAVLLAATQRQRASEAEAAPAATALLVAVIIAGAIGVAALLGGIVELTVANQRAVAKLGQLIDGLAPIPIVAAAMMWGLRARTHATPTAPARTAWTEAPGATTPTSAPPTEQFGSPLPSDSPAEPDGTPFPPPPLP